MDDFLFGYLPILILLGLATILSIVFIGIAMFLVEQKPDPEKLSAYESGFEAFSHSRGKFDVQFYLVAILFIIFDLEIAFFFPWALALHDFGWFGFISGLVFFTVLLVGFLYEWKKGALEW
ncbi:MAG: NADH-quinone oxidoreductase subunit A [Rhodothalassiaceae bacterium]